MRGVSKDEATELEDALVSVTARSTALKQSGLPARLWIASRSLPSGGVLGRTVGKDGLRILKTSLACARIPCRRISRGSCLFQPRRDLARRIFRK